MQIHVFGVDRDGDEYRVTARLIFSDAPEHLIAEPTDEKSTEELGVYKIPSEKAERLQDKIFSADQIETWKQANDWDIRRFLQEMAEAD